MALTPEDLAQIKELFSSQPVPAAPAEPTKGQPDPANSLEAAPVYYVHLADGQVLESQDSASTHMDVSGVSVQVIGRFLKGA
jgi:hypothetical protein